MNEQDTRYCPFCGEQIKAEAIKCRHCRRMLNASAPTPGRAPAFRDLPGRMLAGVCMYVAEATGAATALVRIAFVAALLLAFPVALSIYAAIWVVIPFRAGEAAPAERIITWVRETFFTTRHAAPPAPATVEPHADPQP